MIDYPKFQIIFTVKDLHKFGWVQSLTSHLTFSIKITVLFI